MRDNFFNNFFKNSKYLIPLLSFLVILMSLFISLWAMENQKMNVSKKAAELKIRKTENSGVNLLVNSEFKLGSDSVPLGWEIVKYPPSSISPAFSLDNAKRLTVFSKDKGAGIFQKLPDTLTVPVKLETSIIVSSGRVHVAIIDDKGAEIYAGELKPGKDYQKLSAEMLSDNFADYGKFKLSEVRITSAEKNSTFKISNISLRNFKPISPQTRTAGVFEPSSWHNPRVLFVTFNPVENGRNLVDYYRIGGTRTSLQIESIMQTNVQEDFFKISDGQINYSVVKKINITSFPPFLNGFQYNFSNFQDCVTGDPRGFCERQKFQFDHITWARENNLCEIINNENIDMVLLGAPAFLGTWENFMFGPPGNGFDVSGGRYEIPECNKHVVFNTVNYNYGSDTKHISHVYGHQVEAIMENYVGPVWTSEDKIKYWENFSLASYLYANPDSSAPHPFCGNIHRSPNSTRRYEDNNRRYEVSTCPDWKNMPRLTGATDYINCEKWNCGSNDNWETYWLSQLPRFWWSFLISAEDTIRYHNSGAPIPPDPIVFPTPTPTPTPSPFLIIEFLDTNGWPVVPPSDVKTLCPGDFNSKGDANCGTPLGSTTVSTSCPIKGYGQPYKGVCMIVPPNYKVTGTSPSSDNLFSLEIPRAGISTTNYYFGFNNWNTGGKVLDLVVTTITPIPTITPRPECNSNLDLNRNGKIDSSDLRCVRDCFGYSAGTDAFIPSCFDDLPCQRADFNHDSVIDNKDTSRYHLCNLE